MSSFQAKTTSFKEKIKRSITKNQNSFHHKKRNLGCFTVSERNKSWNQKMVIKREYEERSWLNWKKSEKKVN